jgi:hypothetical protein
MLHIRPKIDKILSYPKFITYNKILKYKVPTHHTQFLDSITFESSKVKDIMSIEEINKLNDKLGRRILYDGLAKNFDHIHESINKVANDIIKKDILEHSYFTDIDTWNITNLLRQYQVQPFEVFVSLVASDASDNLKEELHNVFNEHVKYGHNEKYAYFDYYEGIAVKNSIPSNINDDDIPCQLNFGRYDYNGWERISKLLMSKINSRTNNFKKVDNKNEKSTIISTITTGTIIFNPIKNQEFNDYVEKSLSSTMKKYIDNKTTNYWNHRYNCRGDCEWASTSRHFLINYYKPYINLFIFNFFIFFIFSHTIYFSYKNIHYL